jgi:hypothetical protein
VEFIRRAHAPVGGANDSGVPVEVNLGRISELTGWCRGAGLSHAEALEAIGPAGVAEP